MGNCMKFPSLNIKNFKLCMIKKISKKRDVSNILKFLYIRHNGGKIGFKIVSSIYETIFDGRDDFKFTALVFLELSLKRLSKSNSLHEK